MNSIPCLAKEIVGPTTTNINFMFLHHGPKSSQLSVLHNAVEFIIPLLAPNVP